jgi:hypothetical protein
MGKSQNRPRANAKPPELNQPVNILKKLLDIELERLETAVRIEKERNIVFPETTVIIRDIQKLNAAIERQNEPDSSPMLMEGLASTIDNIFD